MTDKEKGFGSKAADFEEQNKARGVNPAVRVELPDDVTTHTGEPVAEPVESEESD